MTYLSRAIEWVSIKNFFSLWLHQADMLDKVEDMDQIMIGSRHLPSIANLMYLPKSVFCDFTIDEFMAKLVICAYSTNARKSSWTRVQWILVQHISLLMCGQQVWIVCKTGNLGPLCVLV